MKKEIRGLVAIFFVTLSVISTTFLLLPTKAESTSISVSWTFIYLTQTWDSDDNSNFFIQVKYKDNNGWHTKNSDIHKCKNIEPGDTYNPAIVFTISYIDVNQYIYIRMMEADWLSKDDQVCKDGYLNTGKGINDGDWDIGIYLQAFFTTIPVGKSATENQYGDWFYTAVTNLG